MSQSIVMTVACYGTLEIVSVNYYYYYYYYDHHHHHQNQDEIWSNTTTSSHPAWKPLQSTRTQLVMSG